MRQRDANLGDAVILDSVALISVLIWLYVAGGRGSFWRVEMWLARERTSAAHKRVVAVIPARNEADVIAQSLTSLAQQELQIPLEIVLVDDNSIDGTVAVASAAARSGGWNDRLTILTAPELQPGWTGKLWALSHGIAQAETRAPDYILLTDADIRHHPTSVATLLEIAEMERCDLVSFMARLACTSLAERLLIPAFVFFFFMLYPPQWIRSKNHGTAGAAGGCILIRPETLIAIGGVASIRGEIIDDCALAFAVKRSGGRIWLGLTNAVESIRPYGSFREIARTISRSAFSQLRHSYVLLGATIGGLFLTYVLPPVLLLSGSPFAIVCGTVACLLMTACYAPMVRFYGGAQGWALTLPFAAVFYAGATIDSALRYARGRGGQWKGRIQDAPFNV
jgi:hopene-associated glycosyltransferase HpnB